MKTFIKLNGAAFFYGFVLFIQNETLVNVYRIQRLIPWLNQSTLIILLIFHFFISTIISLFIKVKYFTNLKIRYLLTILWIPYYIVMTSVFAKYFPITNPGERPLGALGLLLILGYLIYPIYIGLINSDFFTKKSMK